MHKKLVCINDNWEDAVGPAIGDEVVAVDEFRAKGIGYPFYAIEGYSYNQLGSTTFYASICFVDMALTAEEVFQQYEELFKSPAHA